MSTRCTVCDGGTCEHHGAINSKTESLKTSSFSKPAVKGVSDLVPFQSPGAKSWGPSGEALHSHWVSSWCTAGAGDRVLHFHLHENPKVHADSLPASKVTGQWHLRLKWSSRDANWATALGPSGAQGDKSTLDNTHVSFPMIIFLHHRALHESACLDCFYELQ